MSGEASLWQYIRKGMGARWHAQRIEDSLSVGIPDLGYAIDGLEGWIELKHVPAWPARAITPVRPKLTAKQSTWMLDRSRSGTGLCFVLLKVDRTFLLFGQEAFDALIDGDQQDRLRARARAVWERRINWDQFAKLIQFLDFDVEGEA